MRRLLALVSSLVCVLVASLVSVAPIGAQNRPGGVQPMSQQPPCEGEECEDHQAPTISLETPTGYVYTQYPTIWIRWCDDVALNSASRLIKVNGVTRTSSFDHIGLAGISGCTPDRQRSISTTVPLNVGENTIYARIADQVGNLAIATFSIYRAEGQPPVVSLAPYSADLQDYSRCTAGCFAATYAQSTVPYYSLDAARNVTLVYNGDRADPKPFVHVNVTHGGDAGNLPSYFRLRLRKADNSYVTFLNGDTELHFTPQAGVALRLGGQFSASGNGMSATAVYPVTVVVGAQYANSYVETTVATKVIVVNESASPVGRGWTLGGIQRLYAQGDGGALITEGDGSATYFAWNGSSYVSPAGDFSRLTSGGSGYLRWYPDSSKATFTTAGRMTRLADSWGNAMPVVYDDSNRVWKLLDPADTTKAITLTYDGNGLSAVQDPWGRSTIVHVEANKTLSAITDPDGVSTTFSYDGSLRLRTITDRRGVQVSELGYRGATNTVDSVSAPLTNLGNGTTTRPRTYFHSWQLAGVPYASTLTTPFAAPRADTVRARVTDAGGHLVRFTANAFGQPLATIDPLGNTSTVIYTSAGQVDSVIDPLGVTEGYDYDTRGNVTRATVGGVSAGFHYHSTWVTQPDSIWGDATPRQRFYIGANGRVDSARVIGQAGVTRFWYDSRGRVTESRGPDSALTGKTWYLGVNGNRSRDSLPGGRRTIYGYDAFGRQTTVSREGLGTATTVYDTLNRVIRELDGVNPSGTIYAYNNALLMSVTDPRGQVYGFAYNELGWLLRRTDPLGRADSLQYSAEGLVTRSVNRRGQAINIGYDALHRQRSRSGAQIVGDTVAYSADARIVTATNANSSVTTYLGGPRRQLDSVRTVLSIPGQGNQTYWHRYTYRTNGFLDSVHATGRGSVVFTGRKYGYETTTGALDSIRLGGALTRVVLNEVGQPVVIRMPGIDSLRTTYVPARNVASSYSRVLNDSYHYDAVGRVDQQSNPAGWWNFSYDGLGHLAGRAYSLGQYCGWQGPPGEEGYYCETSADSLYEYQYDEVGNRIGSVGKLWDQTPLWSASGLYGTGNRIQAFAGCSYTTDNDGNVTSRNCPGQTTTFGWSGDGRLAWVRVTGGDSVAFAYDPLGRVVRRDINGAVSTNLLWEGDNLFAELGTDGWTAASQYSYYPGLDRLHAFISSQVSAPALYAHQDALGNVRGLTDGAGNVPRTYQYDDFGELVGGTSGFAPGVLDRARWKGALYLAPEADLYYMRNRWYEPRAGRFLSEDPIGLDGGINPYAYAGGDPVNGADPEGLDLCWMPVEIWTYYQDGQIVGYQVVWGWVKEGAYCQGHGGGGGGARSAPGRGRGAPGGGRGPGGAPGRQNARPDPNLNSVCPLLRPAGSPVGDARISSRFGAVRPRPMSSPHIGADFGVPVGTRVVATAPGVVLGAGTSPSAGRWVFLQHEGGWHSIYMHLQSALVSSRSAVAMGDLIGLSGTGGSGAHLHYGIRRDPNWSHNMNGWFDPMACGQ